MNVGIIEKTELFDVCIFIKKTFEKKYPDKNLKFVTLKNDEQIDLLILDCAVNESIFNKYIQKMKKSCVVLVNVDDRNLISQVRNIGYPLISYGYSQKATITLSSFTTGNKNTLLCAIQRSVKTYKNRKIFEQEFTVDSIEFSPIDTLLLVSVLLIFDLSVEEINVAFFDFFNKT